jgi:hypothetical protein
MSPSRKLKTGVPQRVGFPAGFAHSLFIRTASILRLESSPLATFHTERTRRMPSKLLLFLLACLLPSFAIADDELDKAKAADTANLKKIWEALSAFKKAKGEYPAHLNELVPDYLPDAKVLVSPLGVEADPRAAAKEYDPKLPCTYSYEFSTDEFRGSGLSVREIKTLQLEEWGPTVPILRCFLYEKAINISHAGDFFESDFDWADDSAILKLVEKNGLGPGMKKGKKLVVTLTDAAGKPVSGIPLKVDGRGCYGVGMPERSWKSDEQGKVTIPLGTENRPRVYFRCRAPNWFFAGQAWMFGDPGTAPGSDIAAITVVLRPAGVVGGIVRDEKGAPVAEAFVGYVEIPDPANLAEHRNIGIGGPDENGKWTIESIPRSGENLYLYVAREGYRTIYLKPSAESVPSIDALFAQKAEQQLELPPAFTGTIVFEGKPVAGAKCFLRDPFTESLASGVSDKDGRFTIPAPVLGKLRMGVVAKDFAPKCVEVEITETPKPVTIELDRGRRLTGRVIRGKRAGQPDLPVVFSSFAGEPGTLTDQLVIGTTDQEGRFIWEHAPKMVVGCAVLLPEGEPYEFEWDATLNTETLVELE